MLASNEAVFGNFPVFLKTKTEPLSSIVLRICARDQKFRSFSDEKIVDVGHIFSEALSKRLDSIANGLFLRVNKNIQKLSPQGLTFLLRSIDSASTGKGSAVGENAYKTAVLQAPTVL
ncbi:MAG: hypothetical protein GY822_12320 [Deltaproteobacteria bacterium]|nr:hypothetical protein [Deltaproteobacteria bacterium]